MRSALIAGLAAGPSTPQFQLWLSGTVPVVLAVGEIVLLVVRNQISEREVVVAGNEIDAVIRRARWLGRDRASRAVELPVPRSSPHHP